MIEKFGVPPEKVVEVQALAGDSTDNVPGVPGIGIKTAAQLIVEYGDLETLLLRAGEIKQPKRREALIENAEKARISRQLVLLDDKVKLDVPLDDLAVHEPDARKLIAFLKAMEFSTLTRRVAEYSQIDPADVEADAATRAAASGHLPARLEHPPPPRAQGGDAVRRPGTVPPRLRPPRRERSDRRRRPAGKPEHSKRARRTRSPRRARKRARKTPIDRSKYQTIRNARPSSKAWIARVPRRRPFRDRGQGQLDRSDAGGDRAASRWRWRPTTPATFRSPTSSPATAPACSPPASRRTRSRPATRSTRCSRLLESAGILKIGFNIKFNAVMLAQHGITLRNHDDAQLMSYALDAGRNAHGLDALAERWLGHATISHGELTGSGKNKLTFDQVAIDRRPPIRPRMPT